MGDKTESKPGERTRLRKLFSNSWFITIIGGLVVYGLMAGGIAIVNKINLGRAFGDLWVWIYRVRIPDFYFAVLILLLLAWGFRLNRRIGAKAKAKTGAKLKLTPEHMAILELIGHSTGSVLEEALFKFYMKHFPEKSRKHFNFSMDDLRRHRLIESGFISDEYALTNEGISRLKELTELIDREMNEVQGKPKAEGTGAASRTEK